MPEEQGNQLPAAADRFEQYKWQKEFEFDQEKWRAQNANDAKELELKEKESKRSRWANPVAIAIAGAAVAGLANAAVAFVNSHYQIVLEQHKSEETIKLERYKSEAGRIADMIKTDSPEKSINNLKLLVNSGLVTDQSVVDKFTLYVSKLTTETAPVLPKQIGTQGALAFSGECDKNKKTRLICYMDAATNLADICREQPC